MFVAEGAGSLAIVDIGLPHSASQMPFAPHMAYIFTQTFLGLMAFQLVASLLPSLHCTFLHGFHHSFVKVFCVL
jgi:hypothetical protein